MKPARPESRNPGERQSPIDIDLRSLVVEPAGLPELRFDYSPRATLERLEITPLDRPGDPFGTVLVTAGAGAGRVHREDATFDLLQFHWHAPGEHRLGGEGYPIELHLVHQRPGATGVEELLVVGVWMEIGEPPAELEKIFGLLPDFGATGPIGGPIDGFDLNTLLPGDLASFRYPGSLTTPSATGQTIFPETVDWVVLKEALAISDRQLQAFRALFPDGNCRGVQPLCGRTVLTDIELER